MPGEQRRRDRLGDLLGEHGLAGARLALHQKRTLEHDRGVDRDLEILGRDIGFGAGKTHARSCARRRNVSFLRAFGVGRHLARAVPARKSARDQEGVVKPVSALHHLPQAAIEPFVVAQDERQLAGKARRERAHDKSAAFLGVRHRHAGQDPISKPRADELLDGLDAAELHDGLQGQAGARTPLIDDPPRLGGGLVKDERARREDGGRDARRQRFGIGRGDRHELVIEHGRDRQRRPARRHGDEPDIERMILDELHDIRRVARGHRDVERRQPLAKVAQHGRQEMNAGRRARADAHASERPRGVPRQGLERGRHGGLDAPRMRQKLRSGGRRPRLAAAALDELEREPLLELPHLLAHRGLRQMQPLGRGREAAELDHVHESPQLIGIDAAHPKFSLWNR